MLAAVGKTGKVLGLDRDASALALAKTRLAAAVAERRLELVQARFSEVGDVVAKAGVTGKVAGILADVGVSSMHLDEAERGFSFQADGPLDMRMDRSQGQTAADLVATLDEHELTRLFREYGEEPKAKQIARRIVKERAAAPITTTARLADLVKAAAHYSTPSKKHPATRVFQALRIAVNDELGELRTLLDAGFAALRPGGRLAIIAFHSLEDRLVKTRFVDLTGRKALGAIPRDLPLTAADIAARTQAAGNIIKPFPTVAGDEEIQRNPRARSAKLRVLAKI
jgi:16S rRNA (cytosine1402-N4)-methyltransferase